MSKKLDVEQITSELSGSAFFSQVPNSPSPAPKPVAKTPAALKPKSPAPRSVVPKTISPTSASKVASVSASMLARKQDSMLATTNDTIETIRKTIKTTGREVAFTRLTSEEKNRLTDIVYSLKREGMKTSENEVLRIALILLLEDLDASGEASVLRRVLAALLA